jgi:hypothetical protein
MKAPTEIPDENALLQRISAGTTEANDNAFFLAAGQNLSQALGTCGAWIAEYLPETHRLKALAFWLDGRFVDDYEYDVAGTPCEALLKDKNYLHIPDKVVDLFPGD